MENICGQCGKKFSTKGNLTKHLKNKTCETRPAPTRKCDQCGLEYIPTPGRMKKKQRFCSKKCNSDYWREHHREQTREWHRLHRLKNPLLCTVCHNPIPNEKRRKGVHICSDSCRKAGKRDQTMSSHHFVQKQFDLYKESLGCSVCGYNRYGGCLDYHHTNPSLKAKRIKAYAWYANSLKTQEELKKCVLLCKNCHQELHHQLNQTNPAD